MRRAVLLAASVAASVLIAASTTPGQANWQYTRWGMTIDEARRASQGAMQQVGEKDDPRESKLGTERLRGWYKTADLTFVASLMFDKGGHLSEVKMYSADPKQTPAVVAAVRAKYGSPDRQQTAAHNLYWYRNDDQIWLKTDSGRAEISYCKKVVMTSLDRLRAGLAALLIKGLEGRSSN